jgi:peptidoglycan hydrolase CwlO-like protein
MKAILVTIFLIFISTSLALKSENKKQLSIHGLQLDKISTFGSALKGLIQLAEISEFDEVVDILSTIKEEFGVILDRTRSTFSSEQQAYDTNRQNLEDSIARLKSAIDETSGHLATNEGNRDRLEAAIQGNLEAIKAAQSAHDDEVARRAAAKAAYEQTVVDIAGALVAVSEAREILERIQSADLTTTGFSFVQVQRKKFAKQLSLIQEKISRLHIKTSPMPFYVKELIQIAQDADAADASGVNAEIFVRIFALLTDFDGALRAESAATVAANEADATLSASTLALLEETIAAQQTALALNQETLATTKETIASLQEQLANLNASLDEANENLNSLNAAWTSRSATLQGYIKRLEGDIDVLERALVFVKSQNHEE